MNRSPFGKKSGSVTSTSANETKKTSNSAISIAKIYAAIKAANKENGDFYLKSPRQRNTKYREIITNTIVYSIINVHLSFEWDSLQNKTAIYRNATHVL